MLKDAVLEYMTKYRKWIKRELKVGVACPVPNVHLGKRRRKDVKTEVLDEA